MKKHLLYFCVLLLAGGSGASAHAAGNAPQPAAFLPLPPRTASGQPMNLAKTQPLTNYRPQMQGARFLPIKRMGQQEMGQQAALPLAGGTRPITNNNQDWANGEVKLANASGSSGKKSLSREQAELLLSVFPE